MEFLTKFPVMERTSLMELRKGIDLTFREFSRAYGDSIEAFFDSLYLTLTCDLKYYNIIILFGYDEIALPFLGNEKYRNPNGVGMKLMNFLLLSIFLHFS